MKFLQAIRFDDSDSHVFQRAAAPGEWAVSGAFAFGGLEEAKLEGKTRQAFANGFLGLSSFGRCTVAAVAEMDGDEQAGAEAALARHLVEAYGAPDTETAAPAAREEIAFIADLCADAPVNTLFAVSRSFADDGQIHEQFRIVQPPSDGMHARIWDIVPDDA